MIIIIIIIKTIKITTNTANAKMFLSQAIILRPSWESMTGSRFPNPLEPWSLWRSEYWVLPDCQFCNFASIIPYFRLYIWTLEHIKGEYVIEAFFKYLLNSMSRFSYDIHIYIIYDNCIIIYNYYCFLFCNQRDVEHSERI